MPSAMRLAPAIFALLVYGCGPESPGATAPTSEGASATASTTSTSAESSTTGPTTGASTGATESTGDAPTTGGSMNFVPSPDLPAPGFACDPWQDTCPEGQKCKPQSL